MPAPFPFLPVLAQAGAPAAPADQAPAAEAQAAAPEGQPGAAQPEPAKEKPRGLFDDPTFFILMPAFILIYWMVFAWPQQKERKKHRTMIDEMKKNDRVVTTGGMIGNVAAVSDDGSEITLRFGDNVRIPFQRAAIAAVLKEARPTPGEKKA